MYAAGCVATTPAVGVIRSFSPRSTMIPLWICVDAIGFETYAHLYVACLVPCAFRVPGFQYVLCTKMLYVQTHTCTCISTKLYFDVFDFGGAQSLVFIVFLCERCVDLLGKGFATDICSWFRPYNVHGYVFIRKASLFARTYTII